MSLRAMFLAFVARRVAADDINLDFGKLTDFSTSFELDVPGSIMGVSTTAKGTLQVDLFGERLKIVSRSDYDVDITRVTKGKGKGHFKGHEFSQFTINVPESFVSLRFDEHGHTENAGLGSPSADVNACVKINFPKGLISPSYTAKFQQYGPMVQQTLNSMPHEDVTIDGKGVVMFGPGMGKGKGKGKGPPVFTGLQHDGVPVGVSLMPPQNGEWSPMLKFTHWTKGAGEFPEIPCKTMEPVEFIAHPQAAKTFAVLDQVMATMKNTPTLSLPLALFPEQPSLIFHHAAEVQSSLPTCLAEEPANSLSLTNVGFMAGAFGGVIASLVFFMSTKRASRQVALLPEQ